MGVKAHIDHVPFLDSVRHRYLGQDTADAGGDLFFDMHNVYLQPFQCPHGAASGHGCSNPEADSPDLVVNKYVRPLRASLL